MTELAKRKCEACVPGTPPIDIALAEGLHQQLDSDWILGGRAITRKFEFRNFHDAFGLATRIALLAEDQGHHPDLRLGWGYLTVELTTHAAGGLTDNDFIMGAKIDRLVTGTGVRA